MAKLKKRTDGYMKKTFTVQGKRYYVYGRNQQELFEKEQAKREEIAKGFEIRENPTVSGYFERWQQARREVVRESTWRGQDKQFNTISKIYIKTADRTFGEMRIKQVNIDDLRFIQNTLKADHKTQTVNDYMAFVKHIFADATKERILEYNPCILLKTLKVTEQKARDTHHRALSIQEQQAFFGCERCQNAPYYDALRLAIHTGMRIGEIGALRYSDIKGGFIHVERTITRTETGGYRIGDMCKTDAGKRSIPVTDAIREIIDHQKQINALLYGNNVIPMDALLFRGVGGGLLLATVVDREVKKICSAAGIEQPITCHALRATFATRCIEAGMNPRTLQELLGHSRFEITMSLYGHVMEDTKTEAMNRINIAI